MSRCLPLLLLCASASASGQEPVRETETQTGTGTGTESETETEAGAETQTETEAETETQTEVAPETGAAMQLPPDLPPPPSYREVPPPGARPAPAATPRADSVTTADWEFEQVDPDARGPEHLHQGFFLRLHLGLGWFVARFAPDDRGPGVALGISAGVSVNETLVVFATVDSLSAGDNGNNTGVYLLGVGLTYWLREPNIYFSGALGTGRGTYRGELDDTISTDNGLGLEVMAGKEWHVGGAWGIGGALFARHGNFDEGNFNAVGLVGSATWH